jgi:hypothetical protein
MAQVAFVPAVLKAAIAMFKRAELSFIFFCKKRLMKPFCYGPLARSLSLTPATLTD